MAELKKEGKVKALIVTGCMAERYKDEILEEIPEVDEVLGTTAYDKILDAVDAALEGNQEVILRKSRVKIDNDNIFVLQFLEMMNSTSSGYFDDERKAVIKSWIRKCNISQELVTKYAPFFPDKALRNLIESGVIYYVA